MPASSSACRRRGASSSAQTIRSRPATTPVRARVWTRHAARRTASTRAPIAPVTRVSSTVRTSSGMRAASSGLIVSSVPRNSTPTSGMASITRSACCENISACVSRAPRPATAWNGVELTTAWARTAMTGFTPVRSRFAATTAPAISCAT